jgi:hypothetical protein
MHSFHPTYCRWILDAILHCDRFNHRPTPANENFRQSFSPVHASDRPSSPSQSFSLCDRPPLPQCKTLSLRRESAKRSAGLHLSQKLKRLTRSSRKTMRYDLGFLWGLWLPVAVQNMIRYSPQRMPSAERSFIPSCPTPAAGATA